MRSPKVRLYIRVRLRDGRYAYRDPIWNRNRTLRAGYALIGGQPEVHPEGIYYLRFLRGEKRVWRAVGPRDRQHHDERHQRSHACEGQIPRPGVHGRTVRALRAAAECLPERRYPGGWAAVLRPVNADDMNAQAGGRNVLVSGTKG